LFREERLVLLDEGNGVLAAHPRMNIIFGKIFGEWLEWMI
jgi:hypothetical protein